jgi:hypothetical protein
VTLSLVQFRTILDQSCFTHQESMAPFFAAGLCDFLCYYIKFVFVYRLCCGGQDTGFSLMVDGELVAKGGLDYWGANATDNSGTQLEFLFGTCANNNSTNNITTSSSSPTPAPTPNGTAISEFPTTVAPTENHTMNTSEFPTMAPDNGTAISKRITAKPEMFPTATPQVLVFPATNVPTLMPTKLPKRNKKQPTTTGV